VAKHIAAPEKAKATADKKEAAGGCLGLVGLIFCLIAIGSLIAYTFFPDSGSRPNEERLDTFRSCGIFGAILLVFAWRLFASSKKSK